jgi:predicted MFS family arabinose efflux permease
VTGPRAGRRRGRAAFDGRRRRLVEPRRALTEVAPAARPESARMRNLPPSLRTPMSAQPSTASAADAASTRPPPFSRYQKFVVGVLAFLQFAVIVDFMLMAPLGVMIMPALSITPDKFGVAVSAYAFSAGLSSLVTAGFADRFDRKRLLLFFYGGFVLGTLWCGLAGSYAALLGARIVTGLFGGVIGSIIIAIATDLFPPQMRGRVMGTIQTSFAASQVLGIPVAVGLSNHWGWHVPFIAMAVLGAAGGLVVAMKMKPVDGHLGKPQEHGAFMHLWHTLTEPRYLLAFLTVTLLTTGGFMLMPFSSAYTVHNLRIDLSQLPLIYFVTGLCTIFVGPLVGRAADRVGKLKVFLFGSAVSVVMVLVYTHLPPVPIAVLIVVNVVMFVGIFSRMIPFQAMSASLPVPQQRGAYSAIGASIQQLSGAIASVVAGQIVVAEPDGRLLHFDVVGDVMVATAAVAAWLVWRISVALKTQPSH